MSDDDIDTETAWRNLVVDWHLRRGLPDCGCDDDTADDEFCPDSVDWADMEFAARPDPALNGTPDRWEHDVWVAAWGRNAPVIADYLDFRMPKPPAGMTWLVTRMLVRGQQAVDVLLLRLGEERITTVALERVCAEPTTVVARARKMLQDLAS